MADAKIEELAKQLGALSNAKLLAAFRDIYDRWATPEDAYLKYVWGFSDQLLGNLPKPFKERVKSAQAQSLYDTLKTCTLPQFQSNLEQYYAALPSFKAFYQPIVEAGLLSKDYSKTTDGAKLHGALEAIIS